MLSDSRRDYLWTTACSDSEDDLFYTLKTQDYNKMDEYTNTIFDFIDQMENLQEIMFESFIDNNRAKYFMEYFLNHDYENLGLVVSQAFKSNLYDFIKFVNYDDLNPNEKLFLEHYFDNDLTEIGKLISGVFSTSKNLEIVLEQMSLERYNSYLDDGGIFM